MRLDRQQVENQIAEMWESLVRTPMDDTFEAAVADAHRVESDLRASLARQDRLDAAAPELLAACKAALSAYEPVTLGTFKGIEIKGQLCLDMVEMLKAAIALAEGKP